MTGQDVNYMQKQYSNPTAAGFSLIELLIAMSITLILAGMACTLLAASFNIRGREDQKTAALADAQHALNLMSREIANSGFGLMNNGIVAADSTVDRIRIRANLNAFDRFVSSASVSDPNEDIGYKLVTDSTNSYIQRLDVNTGARTTILANRVDALRIRYFRDKVTYINDYDNCNITNISPQLTSTGAPNEVAATPAQARFLVMSVCVDLPARGSMGSSGYQPPSKVLLVSNVALRNVIQ